MYICIYISICCCFFLHIYVPIKQGHDTVFKHKMLKLESKGLE